ncbi:MAG: tetratricopeptide repeat protein, partial [Bifidobacteriaceae bacterium]|nr:tetratricopeptide repeat protein [Bifidobacteriaceae bacterium]
TINIDMVALQEAVEKQNNVINSMVDDAIINLVNMGNLDDENHTSIAHSMIQPSSSYQKSLSSKPNDSVEENDGFSFIQDDDSDDEVADKSFEEIIKDSGLRFDEQDEHIDNANVVAESAVAHGEASQSVSVSAEAQSDGLVETPEVKRVFAISFTYLEFVEALKKFDPNNIIDFFANLGAVFNVDDQNRLQGLNTVSEVIPDFHSFEFLPKNAVDRPENMDISFTGFNAVKMQADHYSSLSIQRDDLFMHALALCNEIRDAEGKSSAQMAQEIMDVMHSIKDPELVEQIAPKIVKAVIDGTDMPAFESSVSAAIDESIAEANAKIAQGDLQGGLQVYEESLDKFDDMFKPTLTSVPRYFNSYAERVVYNHLFVQDIDRTVLIPDNLMHMHTQYLEILSQLERYDDAEQELRKLIAYNPVNSGAYMRLAVRLAEKNQWDEAYATLMNGLRVATTREDAGFIYYRLAYAEWMRKHYDVAAACYIVSDFINSGINRVTNELQELYKQELALHVFLPKNLVAAKAVLLANGIAVWPFTGTDDVLYAAARASVDLGLFSVATPLAAMYVRMRAGNDEVNSEAILFLRSLQP